MGLSLIILLMATTSTAPLAWTYATGNYSWTVAVSHDGRYVIAGSDDMHTYFFQADSSQGKPLWSHLAHGYVRHVAISNNGDRAAASDMAGYVYFFRPGASASPVWSFHSDSAIYAIAISDDGSQLVAGDQGGSIFLFNTNQSSAPIWQGLVPGGVLAVSLWQSRGAVIATSTQGGIYYYEHESTPSGFSWKFQESVSFPQLSVNDDADYVVAGGSDGSIHMITDEGQLAGTQRVGGSLSAISISNHLLQVIAGSTNGNVSRFDLNEGFEKLDSFDAKMPVTSVAISDDGERIAVAGLDGTIWTFNEKFADLIWTFNTGAIVHSLSMSGDGQVMSATDDKGNIYLFREQAPVRAEEPVSLVIFVPIALVLLALGYIVLRRRTTKT